MAEGRTRNANLPVAKAAWDDDIERLFEAWLRRVAAAEAGHREASDRLRRGSLMLGIPVVVLTTIVGTSVFASRRSATRPCAAT